MQRTICLTIILSLFVMSLFLRPSVSKALSDPLTSHPMNGQRVANARKSSARDSRDTLSARRRNGALVSSFQSDRPRVTMPPHKQAPKPVGEFTYVRTIYASPFGRRYGSWAVDYPEADYHFIIGIRDWAGTNLDISAEPKQIPILDDQLFNYPLIYFVEPGYLELSDEEAQRLREYTSRGGFLFLDDFWGTYEWDNVREQMRRVFPEYEIKDLPRDHSLFHCYFDIDEVIQVPGIGSWLNRGVTHEKGGIDPHYMGIQNEKGRLVAFISRNCDLGDAWEWIDDPRYPLKYGLAAYKVGINVIIYAMTH